MNSVSPSAAGFWCSMTCHMVNLYRSVSSSELMAGLNSLRMSYSCPGLSGPGSRTRDGRRELIPRRLAGRKALAHVGREFGDLRVGERVSVGGHVADLDERRVL